MRYKDHDAAESYPPDTHLYNNTPRAHISMAVDRGSPFSCSGDRYPDVCVFLREERERKEREREREREERGHDHTDLLFRYCFQKGWSG